MGTPESYSRRTFMYVFGIIFPGMPTKSWEYSSGSTFVVFFWKIG